MYGVSGTASFRPLDFNTLADAQAAGRALLDQVFVDVPGGGANGLYVSLPSLSYTVGVRTDIGSMRSRIADGQILSEHSDNADFLIPHEIDLSMPAPVSALLLGAGLGALRLLRERA